MEIKEALLRLVAVALHWLIKVSDSQYQLRPAYAN